MNDFLTMQLYSLINPDMTDMHKVLPAGYTLILVNNILSRYLMLCSIQELSNSSC